MMMAEPRSISPTNSTYEEDFMRLVSRLKACPSSSSSISSSKEQDASSPPPVISRHMNNSSTSAEQQDAAHAGEKSSPQRETLGQNSNPAESSSLPNAAGAFSDTSLKLAKAESSSPLPIPTKTPLPSSKAIALQQQQGHLSSSYVKPKPANPLEQEEDEVSMTAASLPKPIPFKEHSGGSRDFAVKMEITPPRKPTLRFHEAEDVDDAAFVENWERKVAQGLKLTGESGFHPDSNTSVQAVQGELTELRKTFSPEDTVLFKVLESGSSNGGKRPTQYVVFALVACLVAIALAYFSR